jgi:hypothetical protein
MSGLAGGGITQVATTFLVVQLTTETVPTARLDTYMNSPLRLG